MLRTTASRFFSFIWLPLLISLAAAGMSHFRLADALDNLIYDYSQLLSQTEPPDDLIIIEIDEHSILQLGRWPWSREVHANLLDILTASGAKAVGIDIIFSDSDIANPDADIRFYNALKTNGKTVLPVHLEQINRSGQIIEVLPTTDFFEASANVGHVHIEYDNDGISRSVYLKEGLGDAYWPHFSVALLQTASASKLKLPGIKDDSDNEYSPMEIVRDRHNLIPFHFPPRSFSSVSYVDVLNGGIPASAFAGKTVLIGATATGLGDVISTPIGSIAGVELNAFIYQALRSSSFIHTPTSITNTAISGLLTLIIVTSIILVAPRAIFLATFFCFLLVAAVSVAALIISQIWVPPVSILIAISLFYPLFSWRRLDLAVSYLRRELKSLRQNNHNSNPEEDLERVILGLNYLSIVLPIKHWQIFDVKDGSKSCINTLNNEAPLNPSTDPKTEMLIARMPFLIAENSFLLEVFWNDIYGKANTKLLQQLIPQSSNRITESSWSEDIVEHTILELNQAKEKSERNSKLIYQTLSQLNEAVIVADICGRVIFINKEAQEFLGEDTTHKHIIDILDPIKLKDQHSWTEAIQNLISDGSAFSYEARLEQNALDFICHGSLPRVEGGESDTIIITMTNTSQLKRVERDRRDALNFLSHDLQSPMVSVLSIIEQERLDNISEQQSQLLDNIETHIKKNLGYAENFLQLSRAENISETSFTPCDMYAVLDAAIYQIQNLAKSKNIVIENKRSQEDSWVLGNSDLLERAIINLLGNAIKYSDNESKITTNLEPAGDLIYIIISDQGCGISDEHIDGLFEQFERGGNQDQNGTGLGLYFVRVVAAKHKGNIQVRSEVEVGSTFILSLPLFTDTAFY